MSERDTFVYQKIIQYAERISEYVSSVSFDFAVFESNDMAKDAIAMCILQIGELVGRLSEETKAQNNAIPWSQVKAMRNIAAHGYESFNFKRLWETATVEIPQLKEYCENILKNSGFEQTGGQSDSPID
jgi:uncharacterized protein with HEPN domain